MKSYQVYHKHTSYSNVYTKDSPLVVQDYLDKFREDGGKRIYSTVEHGYQSPYYRIYDEIEEYNKKHNTNIKFVFGAEVYWVKDRFSKDRANCHMVLLAKNDKGRKAINKAISIANKTGYYYKPRLDLELILNLPKSDVFITTACIQYWNKYEDIDEITLKLNEHFDDFFLEVQAHQTEKQKHLNKHILELSEKYDIPIIAGTDSHVIHNSQLEDRDDLLKSSKISYDDEEGWYLDVPSYDEFVRRFQEQGVLSDEQIITAIENTNLTLDFEDIVLDRNIKIPTFYPDKNQEEKDRIFIETIYNLWEEEKLKLPIEKHPIYQKEIVKEINEILGCGMCDYFLTNKRIIEKGIENGGELTQSGRGSNVSMYLNKLLGFTNIDCIAAPIDMYSERFLTKERVLESKTPPDEDFNVSEREPFILAQKQLLGETSCYDLIAFGTLKLKSAFKMYARANDIQPDVANEVSKQIDKYEKALLYAEEDEKEDIQIEDFVDMNKFGYVIEGCQRYLGIIDNRKPHPCSTVISSCDIEEEIGIILCKSETTKKEVLTALIESATIDSFGWLKNDFLVVDSTRLINAVYKRIGIKPIEINDLLEILKTDTKTWDIYAKGLTQSVNQIEKPKTRDKMMRYKAKNIVELTQFIAAIRPSFKSLYSKFENREKYEYGIKALDDILQNEYCHSSFILFQEDLMKILAYAGFPMKETYTVIKAISKKKKKKIEKVHPKFIEGFKNKILEGDKTISEEKAIELSNKVWDIVNDFSSYGFNSPHGFSYAIDSVTQAWQKAHYPYEFYEVVLQRFTEKGEKDKVALIKQEMKEFNIELKPIKFRDDNRKFVAYKDRGYISQPLNSIKNISKGTPEILYNLKDIKVESFTEFLIYIAENKIKLDKTNMEILIKADYFSEFGTINNLLEIYKVFKKEYNINRTEKTKIKKINMIKEVENSVNIETNFLHKVQYQNEVFGYIELYDETLPKELCFVTDVTFNQYGTPFIDLYNLSSGKSTSKLKVQKWTFNKKIISKGDLIQIISVKDTKKQWIKDRDEHEPILYSYRRITNE